MAEYRISAELLERAIEAAKCNWAELYDLEEPTEEAAQLIADLEAVKAAEESLTMIEIAKQHQQAVRIIAGALIEMSRMVVAPEGIKHNATAIIARLAGEGFVLEKCKA